MIADLGNAEGINAFGEDADDGEGNAADGKSLADGSAVAAIKPTISAT